MSATLLEGDVSEIMPNLPSDSFDAMLTDPPYGLKFMGKRWDAEVPSVEVWAEALRVLKPGAFGLVFGGTRTFHRLAVAIEDAGFEIRDTLMWVYGSGFPKSRNLDGEWQGYGSALKPAWEPILLVRKPSPLTYAENATRHGTGALNIDGCRIGTEPVYTNKPFHKASGGLLNKTGEKGVSSGGPGRWPANLIHDGSDEVAAAFPLSPGQQGAVGPQHGPKPSVNAYGDYGPRQDFAPRLDTGSAARFFYAAKASASERNAGIDRNAHPTVKPLALTEYLARLLLPPPRDTPRRILVPFAGSGSEIIGALRAGWDEAVGIERDAEYIPIAEARIAHWTSSIQLGLLEPRS